MQTTPLINATTKVEHDNAAWKMCRGSDSRDGGHVLTIGVHVCVLAIILLPHTSTVCRTYLPPSFGTVAVTSMSTV